MPKFHFVVELPPVAGSITETKHFSRDAAFNRGSLVLVWSLIEPHIKVIVPQLLNRPPPYLSHSGSLLSALTAAEIKGFLFQLSADITGFIYERALQTFKAFFLLCWYTHVESVHLTTRTGNYHSSLICMQYENVLIAEWIFIISAQAVSGASFRDSFYLMCDSYLNVVLLNSSSNCVWTFLFCLEVDSLKRFVENSLVIAYYKDRHKHSRTRLLIHTNEQSLWQGLVI